MVIVVIVVIILIIFFGFDYALNSVKTKILLACEEFSQDLHKFLIIFMLKYKAN